MAREDDIRGFTAAMLVIPAGATAAVLMIPYPGEAGSILKYSSGGSLEIIGDGWTNTAGSGAGGGQTYTGTTLIALAGTGYLMGTSEAVNISGPARYYLLNNSGTTTIAYLLKGVTSGW